MPAQDTTQLKEKIITHLRLRGPNLPVPIAKEIGQSTLFTSAFLSELYAEKRIKISNMKIGSSPAYYLPHQTPMLEKFSEHLKSKEKDAYLLLRGKKFLIDRNQEPAIRVALRAIKDFAIPFEKDKELIWRYLTIPQEEFEQVKLPEQKKEEPKIIIPEQKQPEKNKQETEEILKKQIQPKETEKQLEIFDKPKKEKKAGKKQKSKQKKQEKPVKKKIQSSNKNDKFFNSVKETLNSKGIDITDIIGFNKSNLILKINEKSQEKLLIAYNKKRIDEKDIINAHKKAIEFNLPYTIFSLGEPNKKILGVIDAIKSLSSIEQIK